MNIGFNTKDIKKVIKSKEVKDVAKVVGAAAVVGGLVWAIWKQLTK